MAPIKSGKRMARKSATAGPSKAARKSNAKLPSKMTKQVKTKPGAQTQKPQKKKVEYSEKQLNLPVLNSIVPATAKTAHRAGGTGKKKNKVYVDDPESMATILAIVNAEKEGHIESKVAAERQKEEIRQARLKEAEAKEQKRKGKLEQVKDEIKDAKKDKKSSSRFKRTTTDAERTTSSKSETAKTTKKRKSVSFAG